MWIRTVHFYFEIVLFCMTWMVGSLVIYLSMFRCRDVLKDYRNMLTFTAVVDMVFVLNSVFTMETFYVYEGVLYYYSDNPLYPKGQFAAYWSGAMFSFFVLFSIIITVIQFMYRYGLLCRPEAYTKLQIGGAFACFTVYIVIHHYFFWWTFNPPNAEYNDILRRHGQSLEWYIVADLRSVNWVWLHFMSFQMVVSVSYTFNILFGVKIIQFLKAKASSMSEKTLRAQKQITYVLFIQALCPLMDTVIPASFVCLNVIIARNAGLAETAILASMAMNIIPFCNSLVVILVIPKYRQLVWKMLRHPLTHASVDATHTGSVAISDSQDKRSTSKVGGRSSIMVSAGASAH
ncbi:unnamed protein product [Bursaphelenchus xylophilus]|uniref:(pine wood nematode) hypothetical protein n=1 Tax=Bursaphelenchus xylophilus TaxID=6326 RepID=A0A1I7S9W5_BURXY|nr:unnamed protein product [Bursaphelenchus xylophilus]CAG9126248.1 unnamed protein product [Bursaphelenchus xylophilus]